MRWLCSACLVPSHRVAKVQLKLSSGVSSSHGSIPATSFSLALTNAIFPTPACSELYCKDHFPRLSFCSCHPCFTCFCWFLLANSSYLSLLSGSFTAFFPVNLIVTLHTQFLTVSQPLVTASASTCCISQHTALCFLPQCLLLEEELLDAPCKKCLLACYRSFASLCPKLVMMAQVQVWEPPVCQAVTLFSPSGSSHLLLRLKTFG